MKRYLGVYAQQDGREYGYSAEWPEGIEQGYMELLARRAMRSEGVTAKLSFHVYAFDRDLQPQQQAEDEEA